MLWADYSARPFGVSLIAPRTQAHMSLGITLVFRPGPNGHWRQLYLRDMEAFCPACGFAAVQRYYLDAPFHSLTVSRLAQLSSPETRYFQATCEQCGAEVGTEDVARETFNFGFADGEGLIQRFVDDSGSQWRLAPHDHFDGQRNLEWEVSDDISAVLIDELTEAAIFETFGRFLNPKAAFRQLLGARPFRRQPIGRGIHATHVDAVDSLHPDESEPSAVAVKLPEASPGGRPLPGRTWEWLPESAADSTETILVETTMELAGDSLRRAANRFPMECEILSDGAHLSIRTELESLEFDLGEIAREAALTASEPGDIARIELDRAIHSLQWEAE